MDSATDRGTGARRPAWCPVSCRASRLPSIRPVSRGLVARRFAARCFGRTPDLDSNGPPFSDVVRVAQLLHRIGDEAGPELRHGAPESRASALGHLFRAGCHHECEREYPGSTFRIGETSRTPGEILAHFCDLYDWANWLVKGEHA